MKTCLYVILFGLLATTLIAADAANPAAAPAVPKPAAPAVVPAAADTAAAEPADEEVKFEDIQLPEKDSAEYWVVRSEAIGELVPLLTKKRAEMKKKRQMLADYILQIGKAEDMASQKIEVPEDPALYAKALGVDQAFEEHGAPLPTKLPTWEELAEMAMRFIIDEGYLPVEFDSEVDKTAFADVAKKKEEYAQKVRKEMRGYATDCIKMWIYLGTIGEQDACKEWAVQMKMDVEKTKAAERAMMSEQQRMAAADRRQSAEEQKFEDAQERASFRSSRRERVYTDRQDQRQYQQTLLNERYTNSYHW
ncbi:MAG: hypothetical protein L0Y36_08910 [Planctomycetales bacterium]|nr:hypothetical protein [Planctomycetales bacterium]